MAAIAYCMISKAYDGVCSPEKMANRLLDGQGVAYTAANRRCSTLRDDKVCAVAEAQYGKNGSRFKGMLKP
jgi:hypothetical protein